MSVKYLRGVLYVIGAITLNASIQIIFFLALKKIICGTRCRKAVKQKESAWVAQDYPSKMCA